VRADLSGHAHVWRRAGARTERAEHRFPNWFLLTGAALDLLSHLPAERISASDWRERRAALDGLHGTSMAVVELEGAADDPDAYRYLVLTEHFAELETTLVEMSNKRDGGEARTLGDLRGLVLVWDPVEQFLTLTGRTYF